VRPMRKWSLVSTANSSAVENIVDTDTLSCVTFTGRTPTINIWFDLTALDFRNAAIRTVITYVPKDDSSTYGTDGSPMKVSDGFREDFTVSHTFSTGTSTVYVWSSNGGYHSYDSQVRIGLQRQTSQTNRTLTLCEVKVYEECSTAPGGISTTTYECEDSGRHRMENTRVTVDGQTCFNITDVRDLPEKNTKSCRNELTGRKYASEDVMAAAVGTRAAPNVGEDRRNVTLKATVSLVAWETGGDPSVQVCMVCRNKCDDTHYGPDCQKECGHCDRGAQCRKDTGVCPTGCAAGWGPDRYCKTRCGPGFYGSNCGYRCSDGCAADCDDVTGHCDCRTGWIHVDQTCNTKCPKGSYGDNCNMTCGHCAGSSACEHDTGHCTEGCADGFMGDNCQMEGSAGVHAVTIIFIVLIVIAVPGVVAFLVIRWQKRKRFGRNHQGQGLPNAGDNRRSPVNQEDEAAYEECQPLPISVGTSHSSRPHVRGNRGQATSHHVTHVMQPLAGIELRDAAPYVNVAKASSRYENITYPRNTYDNLDFATNRDRRVYKNLMTPARKGAANKR
ncbi:hypothetical protein BaRGS_00026849, partial [Batillaria attramentaria]